VPLRSVLAGLIHTAAILTARLIPPAFSFVLTAAMARILGPGSLGVFVYASALLLLAQSAIAGGLSLQLTRELAAHPESAGPVVRCATTFARICALIAAAALGAHATLGLQGPNRTALLLFILAVIPSGDIAIQEAIFLGRRAYHRVTQVAVLENGIKLLLAGAALFSGAGVTAVCVAVVLARWTAYGYGRLLVRNTLGTIVVPDSAPSGSLRTFARDALPWALLYTVGLAYFRVDILMLQAFRSSAEVGLYGAAGTLVAVLLLLPGAANATLYPRLSAAYPGPWEDFVSLARRALLGLVLVTIPPALLVLAIAAPLLTLLYGAEYRQSAPVLRILAAAVPIHALNVIAGSVLQAANRQTAMVRAVMIALVAQIALGCMLVPRYGMEGAAVALVVATVIGTLVLAVELWPLIGFSRLAIRRAEAADSGETVSPVSSPT
jgi:O-antigen/teichoic acid export membrane protein